MPDPLKQYDWFAVNTRPHRESAAAMNISRLGLEVFLPLRRRERTAARRLEGPVVPLFPGYIFACFVPASYLHLIRYARGVKDVVSAGSTPLPVGREIIDAIRSRIDDEGIARLDSIGIEHGERVVVEDGPLQGLVGVFDRELNDRERVAILLSSISYQASVLLDRQNVKRVEAGH